MPVQADPQIRRARREDVAAIVDIFLRDEHGHGDAKGPLDLAPYLEAFERVDASADHTLYVAELDGEVVGTFQTSLIPGLVARGRTRMKFESVHVRADLRSRGIGEAMMRFAIEEARRRGAGLIELSSNKQRAAAHRFYERLGFAKSHEGFKMLLDGR